MYKIELEKKYLTENEIVVNSETTCFANYRRVEKIDIDNVLIEYKSLIKLAKENDVKIAYTRRFKNSLTTYKNEYEKEITEYNNIFNEYIKLWTIKIEKGLFAPLVEDQEYNNIQKIDRELQKYNYRNSKMSMMSEINSSIIKLTESIKNNTEYSRVSKIYI